MRYQIDNIYKFNFYLKQSIACVATSQRYTHTPFNPFRLQWSRWRILPSFWSRKYCAIGRCTFPKWCFNGIFRIRWRTTGILLFVGFVGATLCACTTENQKWSPLLVASQKSIEIITYRVRTDDVIETGLNIACGTFQFR